MAIANNDVLVVQKTTTGQICKTTVADLIAGAPDNVTSVNGQTGTVVLDLGNLNDICRAPASKISAEPELCRYRG